MSTDGDLAAASASVRIHRQPSKWQDRARAYQVLIDGEPVGEVHNGETGEFAVSAGSLAFWQVLRSFWRRDAWIQLEQVPPG